MFKFDLHWITDGILRQTKKTVPDSDSKRISFVYWGWRTTISVVYGVFHGNEDTQNLSINSQRSTYDDLHRAFMLSH